MFQDILTVARKEIAEAILMTGGRSRVGLVFSILVFGIILPLQAGRAWVESNVAIGYWAWVPLYMTNSVAADSFAGERERKTLETLLASRLSDQAILYGKLVAAVLFGWGLTLANVVAGVVTVNAMQGFKSLIFYNQFQMAAILIVSLIMSLLAAGLGILVSLRATSVRMASQLIGIPATLLFFAPFVLLNILPPAQEEWLLNRLANANWFEVGFTVLFILSLFVGALFTAAQARFRRARLILD